MVNRHGRIGAVNSALTRFAWMRRGVLAAARRIASSRCAGWHWLRSLLYFGICPAIIVAAMVSIGLYRVYFDRGDLPDIEAFVGFEFPTVGNIKTAFLSVSSRVAIGLC